MSKRNGGAKSMALTPVVDATPASVLHPQTEAPSAPDVCRADEKEQILALLHMEVRDLQTMLQMAGRGEIKLEEHTCYITKSMQDIAELMERIESNTPALRHLHDLWEQIQDCPLLSKSVDVFKKLPLDEKLAHFTLLNNQLRKISFQISETAIPRQLNCWLGQSRTGYYIPFHTLFSDQLPELEDRVTLLTRLAWTPGSVKGLVDTENGLIFRYADKKRERYFHIYLVLMALLTACVIALGVGLPIASRIPGVTPEMVGLSWFTLLIGTVVHRAVESLKGRRPPIIAIGEFGLLLSATHGRIILKLLLALIAFFGLILLNANTMFTPFNAFLAGYSLESVVEAFGNGLAKQSAIQVTAFKQQLGLEAKS